MKDTFYYEFRNENGVEQPTSKEQIGLLVEDLDELINEIPEAEYLIERDAEGKATSINMNAIIFVLLTIIRELEDRLNACCNNINTGVVGNA